MIVCPCDQPAVLLAPDIPAGLSAFRRQLAGFPEYRRVLLAEIPTLPPLAAWRARSSDDLGVMLLELAAYVLDVLGFYDERIATECYLQTAVQRASLRRLVGLIGYQPRPALAAAALVAVIVDAGPPLTLPAATGFRSGPFGSEPPQVFETTLPTVATSLRNEWTAGKVPGSVDAGVLFDPGAARLVRDQIAVFRWSLAGAPPATSTLDLDSPFATTLGADAGAGALKAVVARVTDAAPFRARDGATYPSVTLAPAVALPTDRPPDQIAVTMPTQRAMPTGFSPTSGSAVTSTTICLDLVYSAFRAGDLVVLARRGELRAHAIAAVSQVTVSTPTAVVVPVTQLTLTPPLASGWESDPTLLTVHHQLIDGGRLTRGAKTELDHDDFLPPDGVPLVAPVEPVPTELLPDGLLLEDVRGGGASVAGGVAIAADGSGRAFAHDEDPFSAPLRTPVKIHGNLVALGRGETVLGEVLGSGDAAQANQTFTLAKSPLTYTESASAADGGASTLEVWVSGARWRELPSFYGAGPDDRVYIVRRDDEGVASVTFGDGVHGARLPTAIDNVIANYRFGAGAAKPPAGSLTQLAKPVPGIRRVIAPIAAFGGRDADRPKDIRTRAPASALTLGRAVSVADYEALARDLGVVNAAAAWAWDETSQRAGVKVWVISDGGASAAGLVREHLVAEAGPGVGVAVEEATARRGALDVEIDVAADRDPAVVARAVIAALLDPEHGLLALENALIGRPLFASRLFAAAQAVDGVDRARGATLDGVEIDVIIPLGDGEYLDVADSLTVNGVAAGA